MAAARKFEEVTTKLVKQGNSTGLALSRDVLRATGLDRGDSVTLSVDPATEALTIRKADDVYNQAMKAGRDFMKRYRHTFEQLAK